MPRRVCKQFFFPEFLVLHIGISLHKSHSAGQRGLFMQT